MESILDCMGGMVIKYSQSKLLFYFYVNFFCWPEYIKLFLSEKIGGGKGRKRIKNMPDLGN